MLSYSVIMLNTDLHNPQNRVSSDLAVGLLVLTLVDDQKRMTIADYQKNLKGVNDGTDFAPDYLVSIVCTMWLAGVLKRA